VLNYGKGVGYKTKQRAVKENGILNIGQCQERLLEREDS
jgi:hypothetical protein